MLELELSYVRDVIALQDAKPEAETAVIAEKLYEQLKKIKIRLKFTDLLPI